MTKFIIYILCVYIPCDINNDSNMDEYNSILPEISTLCMEHNEEHICIAGDMNTKLTRQIPGTLMVLNGLLVTQVYILHMSILHLRLNKVILTLFIIHLPLLIILLLPNICMIILLNMIHA